MRRKLLTIAAALSLVLFVMAAALWIRTLLSTTDVFFFQTAGGRSVYVFSELGRVDLSLGTVSGGQPRRQLSWKSSHTDASFASPPPGASVWYRLHFRDLGKWTLRHEGQRVAMRGFMFPLWLSATAFGILPAVWLARRWRRLRLRRHLCPRCGYDLRATPDRCPECGAVPEATRETAA